MVLKSLFDYRLKYYTINIILEAHPSSSDAIPLFLRIGVMTGNKKFKIYLVPRLGNEKIFSYIRKHNFNYVGQTFGNK